MKKNNLFVQAIGKFLLGVILIGLLLFRIMRKSMFLGIDIM